MPCRKAMHWSALDHRTCPTQLALQAGGYVGLRRRLRQQKAEVMQANAGAAKSPRPELARPQNTRGAGSLGRRWASCAPGNGWWWYSNSRREAARETTTSCPSKGAPQRITVGVCFPAGPAGGARVRGPGACSGSQGCRAAQHGCAAAAPASRRGGTMQGALHGDATLTGYLTPVKPQISQLRASWAVQHDLHRHAHGWRCACRRAAQRSHGAMQQRQRRGARDAPHRLLQCNPQAHPCFTCALESTSAHASAARTFADADLP